MVGREENRYTVAGSTILLWLLAFSGGIAISTHPPPASGFFTGQPAKIVIGQPNFTTNESDVTSASLLYYPFRTAFDKSGDLWVADENQNRVVEFKPPFSDGMNASLVLGQKDLTSMENETTRDGMHAPVGVTFDASGNLWVVDNRNNRLLEFVPPFSNGMNATIELGQPAGPAQFTTEINQPPTLGFWSPVDMAFDSTGNMWVADRVHHRVVEFTKPFADGESPTAVLGQANLTVASAASSQRSLRNPESLAFDASGNLWVVDQGNNRIVEFAATSLSQTYPSEASEIGKAASVADLNTTTATSSSAVTASGLNAPVGIAFDSAGNMWVSDRGNERVLEFTAPFSDGMNASAVIGQTGFMTDVGATTQTGLYNPLGLTFDSKGNLWVADQVNSRIVEFDASATLTATTNSTGSAGPSTSNSGPLLIGVAIVVVLALVAVSAWIRRRPKPSASVA